MSSQLPSSPFVSPRGKSVVDYFVVPHENIPLCSICKVETMTELLHKGNLFSKISEACKPSDHSVVTATFNVLLSNNASEVISDNDIPPVILNRKIYNLQKDSNNLFNSDMFKNDLMEVIEKLEAQIICQRTVDQNYELFANVILKELDQYLCLPQCTLGTRKRYKYSKPFWNEELTILWKTMRNSENTWKKCKGSEGLKRCLHNKFKLNQNIFDKRLKQIERNFNRQQILNIDELNTKDPKEFWNKIKHLGPKRVKNILMKVKLGDSFCTDTQKVLERWENDFQSLLNRPESDIFNNEFYQQLISSKVLIENEMKQVGYKSNDFINGPIRLDETHETLNKLKAKKAAHIDHIPNEILKNVNILEHLHCLLNTCFQYSVMPSKWKMSIISPIPKGSDKDPYLPLNYRGISLNSCLAKVFSSILNKRIVSYCNELDLLVDEQNGFRAGRSCEDHIYSLTSVIIN